jgi:translocation and assembly module TamA
VGGLSLIDGSAEARVRFFDDYGVVLFLDGGRAYRDRFPDLSDRFFLGAGVGFRYYLSFGPIRVDVAFPLNRRNDVDPSFQFYASIGQSF